MKYDIIFRNAEVFDGESEGVYTDVAVSGDRIVKVGALSSSAEKEIDCSGLTLMPGIIDPHNHTDFEAVQYRECLSQLLQGVTTAVIGNCGSSGAPVGEARYRSLTAEEKNVCTWRTFREFREAAAGAGMNLAPLIGQGSVRSAVIGYDNRAPSGSDMDEMKAIVRDAMEQGAFGLSTGLLYPPGKFAEEDEIIGLAAECAPFGGIYTTHMRSEGEYIIDAIQESVRIAQGAGLPLQISHFKLKLTPDRMSETIDKAVELVEDYRNKGMHITVDRYPYTASYTSLDVTLPDWVYYGGNEEELKRIRDTETREKIKSGMTMFDLSTVMVTDASKNRSVSGMRVTEIAQQRGCLPEEACLQVLEENELDVGAVYFQMNEENMKKVLRLPYCAVCSDASAVNREEGKDGGHPRKFGAFTRFLEQYAGTLVPFTEAVRKMTVLPAEIFGIRERGRIAEGYFADIAVFDRQKIKEHATFEHPRRYSSGLVHCAVNGILEVKDGEFTGTRAGKILEKH